MIVAPEAIGSPIASETISTSDDFNSAHLPDNFKEMVAESNTENLCFKRLHDIAESRGDLR